MVGHVTNGVREVYGHYVTHGTNTSLYYLLYSRSQASSEVEGYKYWLDPILCAAN